MSNTLPPDAFNGSVIPVPLSKEALSQRVKEIASSRFQAEIPKPRKSLNGIKILGTGMATGSKKVDNSDLAALGCDSEWIVQRTGILSRFHTGEDQAVSDMCIAAARKCLANSNVDPSMVDMIVVGTITPDHASPSTACLVQADLDCPAMAMDLNAACTGFVYSLITASQFISTGSARCALVIGADKTSMIADPQDLKTYPLFGDGAGAVLLTSDANPNKDQASGILDFHLGAEGKLGHTLVTPAGGSRMPLSQEVLDNRLQYLQMDGRSVFKWAVRIIAEAIEGTLERTGMTMDDIDLVVPHQANARILDLAIESLGISPDKFFVNVDRYGNTSSGSIPIALHEAVEQGRIQKGSNVLMIGFGAGLTWGSCLFRW